MWASDYGGEVQEWRKVGGDKCFSFALLYFLPGSMGVYGGGRGWLFFSVKLYEYPGMGDGLRMPRRP